MGEFNSELPSRLVKAGQIVAKPHGSEGLTTAPARGSEEFKLVKIDGPNGEFKIAFAGAMPDGQCFLYEDSKHHFFFYAHMDLTSSWTVAIESTSSGKGSGAPLRTTADEEARLRQNIEFFFKSRFHAFPERVLKAGEGPQAVTFQWGIAR